MIQILSHTLMGVPILSLIHQIVIIQLDVHAVVSLRHVMRMTNAIRHVIKVEIFVMVNLKMIWMMYVLPTRALTKIVSGIVIPPQTYMRWQYVEVEVFGIDLLK